ncbi:dihydroneopterin aldolase [Myxococcus sp. K38C18041901]|uniref:dihydroneopterin aldolase n=1 Tax=Myxococcus guangdongensis TaxID=2906760 RepID=UPI0020A6EA96|nr:dihydroneopterin aldolase [Myxococcus guangdongensis]MCP3059146.1 dihydroneopterin aldolase [Myxococcus guangdongensis]
MSPELAFHPPVVRDSQGHSLDVIELRGLTVDCIVGVYNRERVLAQPLRLDVALFLDTRNAATGGRLAHTVNYGRLAGELRFLLEACRFELLESAVEAVSRYLLVPPTEDVPRAQVQAATVRVIKPLALGGLALPSLQVHRTAAQMSYASEERSFGRLDVIHEGAGYGVHRLRVKPGGSLPASADATVEASDLVLGPGLLMQGQPVARGMAFHDAQAVARRYDNPSAQEQTVLRVYRPRVMTSEAPWAVAHAALGGTSYYPLDEPAAPGLAADTLP